MQLNFDEGRIIMFATAMTKFLDRILMLFLKYIKIGRKKYSLAAWTHPSRASVCVCVCQSYLMDSSNPVSKNRFCITTREFASRSSNFPRILIPITSGIFFVLQRKE